MTIASETAKSGPYTGDSANTSFAYDFKVFSKDDIKVVHTVTSTGAETVLTVDVDYTVNDVGSATGTIDYPISGSPLPATETLTLVRNMTFVQSVDLENQGGYYPETVETVFDRIEMKLQQLKEQATRAVTVNVSSSTDPADVIAELLAAAAAAAASETAAGLSETAAAASAASAASDAIDTAADLVQTNLDTIATAADAVSTAADAAATAADVLSTAADAASTAADAVSTAADAAAASTSEGNALAYAASAASDAISAAASYDSFDDRYLGAKAADPTLDNDGDALLTGALYYNTTSGLMRVYDGAAWQDVSYASAAYFPNVNDNVTATDEELNVLDGATAGTAVASKAVVLDASKDIANIQNIKTVQETITFYQEYNTGNSGTAKTINWGNSNKMRSTLTGNCTFTFTAPDGPCNLMLKLDQDATGSRTVTWPASVKWQGGVAPTLTATASAIDIVTFYYDGTNYYGMIGLDFS